MNERKKKKKTRFSLNILNVDPQFNIHVSYRIEIEMNGSPLACLTIHINLINSSPTVLLFEYHLFRE